jgi:hypothetical protein
VIEPLVALRQAIDRAVAVLGPLEPVIEAWEAAQERAQERVGAAADTPIAPNGSVTPGEPTALHCRACGAALPPPPRRGGRRRQYCDQCRAGARSRRPVVLARAPAVPAGRLEPLPDPPRPFNALLTPEDPETAAVLRSAMAPDP